MCDVIWCKQEFEGKPCETVNYLDPFCFWNWEGTINCAECGTVYYIHMIQGFMYRGPEERPGEEPDTSPLYADKPLEGYRNYMFATEGRTRPFECMPRSFLLGEADMVKFSIRGKPVRGWRPQPESAGIAGSFPYHWDIQNLSPDVWEEYQEKIRKGEVSDW